MPRFWCGPADGEICDACDTRITKEQLTEQLVMEGIASTHADEKPFTFTSRCFYVWDAERLRASLRQETRHAPPMFRRLL
jgi:hypothetical protein